MWKSIEFENCKAQCGRIEVRIGMVDDLRTIGAVDIGGTKIAVGAVTEDGRILSRVQCSTSPESGFAIAMNRLKAMLHEVAAHSGTIFTGIGVACPGPLDPISGVIGEVGTLPRWQGENLVDALEGEFGVRVAVENDADAAALAEAHCGAGKDCSRLIYLTVSTGIGAGILLSGQLYRSSHGAHPEIGHQIIDASSGSRCYCRATGCWESLVSGEALANWMQEQRPSPTRQSAEHICSLAEQGDPLAQQAMDRVGFYLGLGLANLITILTPDAILLGGGVMKSQQLFLPRALRVLRDVCTQVPLQDTSINLAALGADAGIVGAAQAWLARHGGA